MKISNNVAEPMQPQTNIGSALDSLHILEVAVLNLLPVNHIIAASCDPDSYHDICLHPSRTKGPANNQNAP
jgi:hypothetical protein